MSTTLIQKAEAAYQRVLEEATKPEVGEPVFGDIVMLHRDAMGAALKNLRALTGLRLERTELVDLDTALPGEPANEASVLGFRTAYRRHQEFLQLAEQGIAHLSGA